uniref:Uncharacterized protein n=1 Tax=Arundo donax TaxID=35708 RepID=A0A0A9AVM4_ARUDO
MMHWVRQQKCLMPLSQQQIHVTQVSHGSETGWSNLIYQIVLIYPLSHDSD